ncbi:MAG TPA: response regulator, partial [Crinalium sp.]
MSTALVIEDSLTEMEILTACLQRGGLNVVTASSGEEGLTKIGVAKPDVIILDVVLPGCSGFE